MRFADPFHDLLLLSKRDMKSPTHWVTDREAYMGILKNAKFGDYRTSLSGAEPFEFMGIKVEVDPDLPRDKVLLKVGDETVGEFTLDHDTKEP